TGHQPNGTPRRVGQAGRDGGSVAGPARQPQLTVAWQLLDAVREVTHEQVDAPGHVPVVPLHLLPDVHDTAGPNAAAPVRVAQVLGGRGGIGADREAFARPGPEAAPEVALDRLVPDSQ